VGAFFAVYVFVAALCVGSFLNVVIARVPHGKSIVRPGSACPRCGAPIRWYDNIPVVSWLLLRGKCRNCALPISARYPVVELLTAVVVLAVLRRFGIGWTAAGYAAFASALIALTFIDLDTWLLPHEITWPLLVAGIASPLWNHALRPLDSVIGAAAGYALFAAIALFGEKVVHRETMGWGDVWLLAGIGAWLGWQQLLPVVFFAAVQGTIVGVVLIRAKGGKNETAGPTSSSEGVPSPLDTASASAQTTPRASSQTSEESSTIPPPAAPPAVDWVPPPHAVPFGPFLALGALEQLLVGPALQSAWFHFLGRLWR
jgi:leader peptidase (prepilin peptidase) / N-methyltransferase